MTPVEAVSLINLLGPIATKLVPEILKLLNGAGGTSADIDRVRFEADLIHAANVAADRLLKESGHDPAAIRAIVHASK